MNLSHFSLYLSGYSIYRISYQTLMTVASFEIVKDLPEDSYALIFGINMFVALGLQTLLTVIVNDTLELNPRAQFEIYAAFYLFPLLLFSLLTLRNIYKWMVNKQVE